VRLAVSIAVLAAGAASGGVVGLGACGSASEGAFNPSGTDGGVGDGSTGVDTGSPDTAVAEGGAADTGASDAGDASAPRTTALMIHASASLPDVRLCWASGTLVTGALPFPSTVMPAANYAGIPSGGAVAMDDATELAGTATVLYAIFAEQLALLDSPGTPQQTCAQLFTACSGPCITANTNYFALPIPVGALRIGKANVLAISGCYSSSNDKLASVERCGTDWSPIAGNLHVEVMTAAAPSAGADAGLNVQAAQLSPGLAQLAVDGGSAMLSFGAEDAGDAATTITALAGLGDVAPTSPVRLTYPAGIATYGTVGFAVDVSSGDAGLLHLWTSLADSQRLVDPTRDPAEFFGSAQTYVVAVVGDPSAPITSAGANGDDTGLHVLVLPSAPPPALGDAAP
jgi:hypothetical protein